MGAVKEMTCATHSAEEPLINSLKIGMKRKAADCFGEGRDTFPGTTKNDISNNVQTQIMAPSTVSNSPKSLKLSERISPSGRIVVPISEESESTANEEHNKHCNQRLIADYASDTASNYDTQLAEELACCTYHSQSEVETNPVSPVPLLTPPASPIHSQSDGSICEWPSNLVIDNALTAISELRAPSLSEVLDCNEPFVVCFRSPNSVCSESLQ